jgi:two-component system, cell cycle response regulator
MLKRALIVDDSIPLHQLIKTLMDGEGLEFESAYDGESGLSLASAVRPSLILLDVDMPDMDGFEVCRRLKANADTAAIPVIFLTADFHADNKAMGMDIGAVDYVTKPFKAEELSTRIRASLRARELLQQKAMIDGLTGLWNQKYLQERAAAQTALASRTGTQVSCIVLDVDGLRLINANDGIPLGDEVLRSIAGIILKQCRPEDVVCRFEGGKFAILMPAMTRAGAGSFADRLCLQFRQQLAVIRDHEVGTTCSFGVADTLVAGDATLLERADLALARAKQNGGNCVSIARPPRKASESGVAIA